MKIFRAIFIFMSMGVATANGAGAITGRVVNSSSAALAYAKVWLKNNPAVMDSTGADGAFSLALSSSATNPVRIQNGGARALGLRNNRIVFPLNAPQEILVDLFTTRGERFATVFKGMKGKGNNSVAIDPNALRLASGAYVLRLTGSELAFETGLVIAGGTVLSDSRMTAGSRDCHARTGFAAAADSLIVLRMGYEIKKMALASVAAQNVGDISLKPRTYKKETTVTVKTGRNIEVILPSDYNDLYSLPVLYLLHGGGTDETTWRVYGHLIDTLNKFADRENMQAMIIITPNAGGSTGYGYYGKTADPFYTDLTVDIKNYVESHYKIDTARFSRAISGLSMGSMQTLNLTLFYPKLWGYSFPMSAGLLKNGGFSVAKFRSDVQNKVIDTAAVNQLKIFKVFSNPTDIAYGDTDTTCMLMRELGIKHLTDFTTKTSGGHTFPFWNEVVRKYAPTLFK
jgi:enterochelin esterase-like enzyme